MALEVITQHMGGREWTVEIVVEINDAPRRFIYILNAGDNREAEASGLKRLKTDLLAVANIL